MMKTIARRWGLSLPLPTRLDKNSVKRAHYLRHKVDIYRNYTHCFASYPSVCVRSATTYLPGQLCWSSPSLHIEKTRLSLRQRQNSETSSLCKMNGIETSRVDRAALDQLEVPNLPSNPQPNTPCSWTTSNVEQAPNDHLKSKLLWNNESIFLKLWPGNNWHSFRKYDQVFV